MGAATQVSDGEWMLLENFIDAAKRQRFGDFLRNPSKREKFLRELPDLTKILRQDMLLQIPKNSQNPEYIFQLLKEFHAPEKCYAISLLPDLDAKNVDLRLALNTIVGTSIPTVLSCVPSQLIYYEGEEPGDRFIGHARRAATGREM